MVATPVEVAASGWDEIEPAGMIEAARRHLGRVLAVVGLDPGEADGHQLRKQLVEPEHRLVARTLEQQWEAKLAAQLKPVGIGVSVLCPSYVRTGIVESGRNRPQRYGPTQGLDPASPAAAIVAEIDRRVQAGLDVS